MVPLLVVVVVVLVRHQQPNCSMGSMVVLVHLTVLAVVVVLAVLARTVLQTRVEQVAQG
jgi:hypothetical protein